MASIQYRILSGAVRLSGMKKIFALPEDKLVKKIRLLNRKRGFQIPNNHKAIYSDRVIIEKYHCLVIQPEKERKKKAVLFFFGGGMCIGPDQGDVKLAVNIANQTNSDVWFPYYPLCTDYSITETYEMCFQCYSEIIAIYGAGNVSLLGFSSGGALAIGMALHNNASGRPLPMPRQIIASSPGSVPLTKEEFTKMQKLNHRDLLIDAKFMRTVRSFMEHGKNVPDYMLSGIQGDFSDLPHIYFYYGGDEVLSAEAEYFEDACLNARTPYTMTIEPGMCHCYAMQQSFPEGKHAFNEIMNLLKYE